MRLTHFYTSFNAGGATFAAKSIELVCVLAKNLHGCFFVLIVSHLEFETKPNKQIVIAQKGVNVAMIPFAVAIFRKEVINTDQN